MGDPIGWAGRRRRFGHHGHGTFGDRQRRERRAIRVLARDRHEQSARRYGAGVMRDRGHAKLSQTRVGNDRSSLRQELRGSDERAKRHEPPPPTGGGTGCRARSSWSTPVPPALIGIPASGTWETTVP